MLPKNRRPSRQLTPFVVCALLAAFAASSCSTLQREPPPPPPAPPRGEPLPPSPVPERDDDPGPVKLVEEPIVVAAWTEPRRLPPGGGQVQVIVRVQRKGGGRLPGVEVRLSASEGTLYSRGRVLTTDAQGMTRDRLTTRSSSVVTLNAGGTRYRFQVDVAEPR